MRFPTFFKNNLSITKLSAILTTDATCHTGKIGEKTLQEIDFRTFIKAIGNDFKIAIDDLFNVLETVVDDVEKLKLETSKSNKDIDE